MEEIDIEISARLRKFRESKHMSQSEMAEILEISEKQYGNIERGKSALSPKKIFLLSSKLNLDPTYLVTGMENPSTALYDIVEDCPRDKIFDLEQMVRYASNLYRNEANRK